MTDPNVTIALARDFCREHLTALCVELDAEINGRTYIPCRLPELRDILRGSFPNSVRSLSVDLVNEAARRFVLERGGR